jgi:hypothetical protein
VSPLLKPAGAVALFVTLPLNNILPALPGVVKEAPSVKLNVIGTAPAGIVMFAAPLAIVLWMPPPPPGAAPFMLETFREEVKRPVAWIYNG